MTLINHVTDHLTQTADETMTADPGQSRRHTDPIPESNEDARSASARAGPAAPAWARRAARPGAAPVRPARRRASPPGRERSFRVRYFTYALHR